MISLTVVRDDEVLSETDSIFVMQFGQVVDHGMSYYRILQILVLLLNYSSVNFRFLIYNGTDLQETLEAKLGKLLMTTLINHKISRLFLISYTQLNISQRTDRQSLAARTTGNSFRRKTTLTASVSPLRFPRTILFTRNLTDDAWNLPVPVPRADQTADSVIWNRSVIIRLFIDLIL